MTHKFVKQFIVIIPNSRYVYRYFSQYYVTIYGYSYITPLCHPREICTEIIDIHDHISDQKHLSHKFNIMAVWSNSLIDALIFIKNYNFYVGWFTNKRFLLDDNSRLKVVKFSIYRNSFGKEFQCLGPLHRYRLLSNFGSCSGNLHFW